MSSTSTEKLSIFSKVKNLDSIYSSDRKPIFPESTTKVLVAREILYSLSGSMGYNSTCCCSGCV